MTRFLLMLNCLFVLAAGCGRIDPPVAKASGMVTFQGEPCDGALVVFHPLAKEKINGPKPVATTAIDGTFSLTTYAMNDGAEPGEYGVTIVWPAKQEKDSEAMSLSNEGGSTHQDRLQGRYGLPKQPKLKAVVKDNTDNIFDFKVE